MPIRASELRDILNRYSDEELDDMKIVCDDESMGITSVTYTEIYGEKQLSVGWGDVYTADKILYNED